jgi:DtxR family Mn-dependent transcriptional regulator
VVHPGLALLAFAVLTLGLYFLLRPSRGWLPRLARVLRVTERVRVEDALKHLLHCETLGLVCTTESLGGALEVSRSRAVALLERLDRMGLARAEGQGHRLTAAGREYGLRLLRTHRLLERYFADRTGMPAQEWHDEAERQEHRLTPAQTERLAARMGHPLYDPHGDPIPSPSGAMPLVAGVPLSEVTPGAVVRVVHLEDEPRDVYDRLIARGFSLGVVFKVTGRSESSVSLLVEGREELLESLLAANVEVAGAGDVEVPELPHRTLADLAVGEAAEVLEIAPTCQGPQRRRLLDLGVVPGTVVRALMASAAGDPIAYDVRGATVALRRGQAAWIRVRSLDTQPAEEGAAA